MSLDFPPSFRHPAFVAREDSIGLVCLPCLRLYLHEGQADPNAVRRAAATGNSLATTPVDCIPTHVYVYVYIYIHM